MATTLHRFSELTPELRIVIWEYALLVPREVAIWLRYNKVESDGCDVIEDYWYSPNPYPPLLYASRESRELVEHHYTRLFRKTRISKSLKSAHYDSPDQRHHGLKGGIYVNPGIDLICSPIEHLWTFSRIDWMAIQVLKVVIRCRLIRCVLPATLTRLRRLELFASQGKLEVIRRDLYATDVKVPMVGLYELGSGDLKYEFGPLRGKEGRWAVTW